MTYIAAIKNAAAGYEPAEPTRILGAMEARLDIDIESVALRHSMGDLEISVHQVGCDDAQLVTVNAEDEVIETVCRVLGLDASLGAKGGKIEIQLGSTTLYEGSFEENGVDSDARLIVVVEEPTFSGYIYVKVESVGEIGAAEASIKDVKLEVVQDDLGCTLIPWSLDAPGTGWTVFSHNSTWMTQYGHERGDHLDVYGNEEGIWRRLSVNDCAGMIQLSFEFKFGRGNANPGRSYHVQIGTGPLDSSYDNFKVGKELVLAPRPGAPGPKSWTAHTVSFNLSD